MLSRSLIFTVGGLAAAAIVAAIAYGYLVFQPRGAPPVSIVTATFAPTPAASSPAPAAQPSAAKPTPAVAAPSPASTPAFDVVRVEPSGDAVVAGRAAPGARVDLSDDGKAIGDVVANDAGQFVILPPAFSPGRHPLRLSAKVGDSAPQVSVVVVVDVAAPSAAVAAAPALTPSPAAAKPTPQSTVAVAATPTPTSAPAPAPAASAVPTPTASAAASTPAPTASAAAATPSPAIVKPSPTAPIAVAVASVRPVDPAGLEAVGSAPPGARVRLRLNNAVLAEVVAGADGEWRLTIERGVTAGDYVLEAAVVDAAGAVLARAESPFVYPQREVVASAAPVASPALTSAAPPAAAEPTPVASAPAASTLVASTPAALTPAAPTPAEPAPTAAASGEPTRSAPAPSAGVAAVPAPSAPAPAQSPAASETPVATAAHAVVAEVRAYTVVKGDNLWDLAVKYYGDGLRYADIFSANASQIRDPNLIYIGQIFVVPAKPTTNPFPAR
jgi:nucleoid-associated protein YgaU